MIQLLLHQTTLYVIFIIKKTNVKNEASRILTLFIANEKLFKYELLLSLEIKPSGLISESNSLKVILFSRYKLRLHSV